MVDDTGHGLEPVYPIQFASTHLATLMS